MSEHSADCDIYDMTEDLVLTGKPCNCNRRAVLLRVAGELRAEAETNAWDWSSRARMQSMADQYEREAAEVK